MSRPPVTSTYSKVSAESRTVLPRVVRKRLGVRPGDTLRYSLSENGVLIDKAPTLEHNTFAVFSEWASDADERAYADL